MRVIFNLQSRSVVHEPASSLGNFISFGRLIEQLRKAGEFRPDEIVTDLIIDVENGGIEYRVARA